MRLIFLVSMLFLSMTALPAVAVPPASPVIQTVSEFPNLFIVNHPLIQHKLTLMRETETGNLKFRQLLREIGILLGYEITKSLPTKSVEIQTPLAKTTGKNILENQIVIVPILRAGLGMAEGIQELIPTAHTGHIGLYRHQETKKPVEYLFKMPKIGKQTFIVVDPMLATGNSAIYAINRLIKAGVAPSQILFMTLLAAPEGVRAFQEAHPSIPVFTAALDEKLDDHAYIVPGLGDAGDRLYGTK